MTHEELFAATAVHSWKIVIDRLDKAIASFSDEELQTQIAPGKNRVYYLVGHLAGVHDRLFPMLFLGERLHPELDEAFLTNPDKALPDPLPAAELRAVWSEINTKLTASFAALPPADWLKRHESVSEEDFAKEPLRNRLSVLISRTGHAAFHAGQIRLIKAR